MMIGKPSVCQWRHLPTQTVILSIYIIFGDLLKTRQASFSTPDFNMSSTSTPESVGAKKLAALRVVDLKQELDKRGLEKTGVKAALIDRLQKVNAINVWF